MSIFKYVQSSGGVLCLPWSERWTVGYFGAVQALIPSTAGSEKGSGMRLIMAKIFHSITLQMYEKLAFTVQVNFAFLALPEARELCRPYFGGRVKLWSYLVRKVPPAAWRWYWMTYSLWFLSLSLSDVIGTEEIHKHSTGGKACILYRLI